MGSRARRRACLRVGVKGRLERAAVVVSLLLGSSAAALTIVRSHFLPMAPRWSIALSAPPGAPPVMAGTVIVVPLQAAVVAFDVADGSDTWRVELSAVHPLSVDAERVYVPAADAVHALSVATGEVTWRADTGTLTAPLLVRSGWVIAASAPGSVAAIRASDGSTVWRSGIGPIEFRPAIDGDLLVLPLADGRLVGLDLQTGASRWERHLGGAPGEPLAVGGKVYAGASDKYFYALDQSNGEIEWRFRVGAAPRGLAAADDDHLYFVAMDNVLWALDRGNGAIEWHRGLPYRPAGGPVLIRGAIFVPGAVAALPVFGPDGAALTDIKLPSAVAGVSDVVVDDRMLPTVAIVTGDLQHAWTIWLLEASTDPPLVQLQPLTTLPGVSVPIGLPL